MEYIGDSISQFDAERILDSMEKKGIITPREKRDNESRDERKEYERVFTVQGHCQGGSFKVNAVGVDKEGLGCFVIGVVKTPRWSIE